MKSGKENLKIRLERHRKSAIEHLRLLKPEKLASWLRGNVAVVVSVSSLLAAVSSVYISYNLWSNQEDQYAWRTISRHVPGNSGIRSALQHLYEKDRKQLHFIDLRPFRNAYGQSASSSAFVGKLDLSSANLMGSWLSNTDFSETNFNNANLTNAKMNQAVFSGADFTDAKLIDAEMNEADFSGADFTDAKLIDAKMNEAVFSGADFTDAELIDAEMNESDFTKSKFIMADLRDVAGEGAIFNDTDLDGATLFGANLGYAKLNDAILNNVSAENLDITHATAINTKFDHAGLVGAIFQQVTGLGMSFSKADMKRASFVGGRFSGSSFRNAKLGDTDFTEAIVTFTDFTDADLTGANLAFASFGGANLSGVILKKIIGFRNAKWEDAWAWSDKLPKLPALDDTDELGEIRLLIKLYDSECKEDWERRIQEDSENVRRNKRKVVIRYHPPDDRCLLSTDSQADLWTKLDSDGAPDE